MGLLKKFALLLLLVAISVLSSTPGLIVINPETWLNIKFTTLTFDLTPLFSFKSGFYDGYKIYYKDPYLIGQKSAHFIFFGTLSLLFLWNLHTSRYRFVWAWILTTTYAIFDEIHQFSVPGRTGTIQDVFVDSISAFIWLSVFYILIKIISFAQYRKSISLYS